MDHLELRILADELNADTAVALAAGRDAAARLNDRQRVSDESCAVHLTRLYNVVEQMALRIAKAFENTVDDEKGWQIGLIRRLSIRIEGVRPALFPAELRQPPTNCTASGTSSSTPTTWSLIPKSWPLT